MIVPVVAFVIAAADCDAKAAHFVVGRKYTGALSERVRTAAHARIVRVLKPGMVYTMEYRMGRVNIQLDLRGRIKSIHCG